MRLIILLSWPWLNQWQIAENKFMQLKASEVSVKEKDTI